MKLHHLIVFSALLGGALSTAARAETLDLTTVSGKTYHQCRVVQIDPDGVMFRHSNGAGKLLFKDMTKDLREHFKFDPDKLREHEQQVKLEKDRKREITEQRARDYMKQQQEAIDHALDRQALLALQQATALAQTNGNAGVGAWYGGLGSIVPIGASYDGADYVRGSRSNRRNLINWYTGSLGGFGVGGCNYGNYGGYGGGAWGANHLNSYTCNYGFTPQSFFAVPGVGPNVRPIVVCPPRVTHFRSAVYTH